MRSTRVTQFVAAPRARVYVTLIPATCVVEVDTFESADPALRGAMTGTITLSDVEGGTEIVAVHTDVPIGVSLADNETGWSMALAKLAALVEASAHRPEGYA